MGSIKTYLLSLFLTIIFGLQGFSQNRFNNNVDQHTEEVIDAKTDSIIVNTYFTEVDYNERFNLSAGYNHMNTEEIYPDGEVHNNERRKKRIDPFFIDVAIDLAVGVIFVISELW